jgi:hypothetical protein
VDRVHGNELLRRDDTQSHPLDGRQDRARRRKQLQKQRVLERLRKADKPREQRLRTALVENIVELQIRSRGPADDVGRECVLAEQRQDILPVVLWVRGIADDLLLGRKTSSW